MKTDKIIKALKRWSPHGLCSDVLVNKNGDPKRTEACAIGCLALEYLHSASGAKFLRCHAAEAMGMKKRALSAKYFTKNALQGESGPGGSTINDVFEHSMIKHFELSKKKADHIIGFNDSCLGGGSGRDVPKKLAVVIRSLREQYEEWREEREGR